MLDAVSQIEVRPGALVKLVGVLVNEPRRWKLHRELFFPLEDLRPLEGAGVRPPFDPKQASLEPRLATATVSSDDPSSMR